MTLAIDIVSDVVCPWCFIGKRKIAAALERFRAEHPDSDPPAVRWHAFQLNPDMPPAGMARRDYLAHKFGSPTGGPGYDRVRAAGRAVGIEFAFERIERQPNTLEAHALVALAAGSGVQDAVVESLFRGYFLEGRDLSDRAVLAELAAAGGLDAATALETLADQRARAAVAEADAQARRMGVQGVPFFIFANRLAVSGAQDPEVLLQALRRAAAEPAAAGS